MANKNIKRSKDIVLSINGKPLCAQKNIDLERSAAPIDITNKIDGAWQSNLQGVKSWKVNCSGVFVVDEDSFVTIENAFQDGSPVEVKILEDGVGYSGNAIIISFPINVDYEDALTYRLKLLGDGPLVRIGG